MNAQNDNKFVELKNQFYQSIINDLSGVLPNGIQSFEDSQKAIETIAQSIAVITAMFIMDKTEAANKPRIFG